MSSEFPSTPWRPSASLAALRARAELLATTRNFFAARGVLEVETPALAAATVTEPAIESLCAQTSAGTRYLQTSPEYAMKRLLAAGAGDIYQVARVFRAGEAGQRHNPEFSLLEWYRVGFSLSQLIEESLDYLATALGGPRAARWLSYAQLFADRFGIDALVADAGALRSALMRQGFTAPELADLDFAGLHDLAYDSALRHVDDELLVVHSFPTHAAALARITEDTLGRRCAERFEIVLAGVEIANGYHELVDADEQRRRFAMDRARRAERGQLQPEADRAFLAALEHGIPECSGVAIGLDRVLMHKLGATNIRDVLAFDFARA